MVHSSPPTFSFLFIRSMLSCSAVRFLFSTMAHGNQAQNFARVVRYLYA